MVAVLAVVIIVVMQFLVMVEVIIVALVLSTEMATPGWLSLMSLSVTSSPNPSGAHRSEQNRSWHFCHRGEDTAQETVLISFLMLERKQQKGGEGSLGYHSKLQVIIAG